MTKKIFHSIILTVSAVLMLSIFLIMSFLYGYFESVQEKRLSEELSIASAAVEKYALSYLSSLPENHDYRLTWISEDGAVLFDTEASADSLPNHSDREEVKEALLRGTGTSSRYSSTLTERTIYCAKKLSDGTILRISTAYVSIFALLMGMLTPIIWVFILALIISALMARRMAKRIVRPLNNLDLDSPFENDAYDELSPLLSRIYHQQLEIAARLRELREKTEEFAKVTSGMREGLVLIDKNLLVLSINPAAKRIFNCDSREGESLFSIDRSAELLESVKYALENGHSEIRETRGDREYLFDVNRTEFDGERTGAVLLIFDMTEEAYAERSRREFSANVSHELKTPLQSIMGSAELLESGMVKEEDAPRFISRIRSEASRLVALIDDIIRLSRLDEGGAMPFEEVDLYSLAESLLPAIEDNAEKKGVSVKLSGSRCRISGVPQLLREIISNLADNAIKYNVPNGYVEIITDKTESCAYIEVKDGGIGIPKEFHDRVFERFFRVDKSHSKKIGGTGLGLSIVKHAAALHGAEIKLISEPGRGCDIKILFPADS